MKIINMRRIGLVVQIGTLLISSLVFWNNWMLGLVLLIPTLFANILTQILRKDVNGITIKLLLLFQSILILFVITKQMTSNSDIDSLKDKIINNYNKNRYQSTTTTTTTNNNNNNNTNCHTISYVNKALKDNKIKHTYHIDNKADSNSNKLHGGNSNTIVDKNKYTHSYNQRQKEILNEANDIFMRLFGEPMVSNDFPDIRYRSSEEVRNGLVTVFNEIPQRGFRTDLKNPCWYEREDDQSKELACLPYAYILGQPKCGTSNLYEHLKKHPEVIMPRRKEVRWFTRGEFTIDAMQQESQGDEQRMNSREMRLGPGSSVYSFTKSFTTLSSQLSTNTNDRLITVDGGPHTFWWPTQNSDGSMLPEDIPAPQIIREMQPNAKFIITLSDPVKRLYSDYYFLLDNLKPVKAGSETQKCADELHERVEMQINEFQYCLDKNMDVLINEQSHRYKKKDKSQGSLLWLRASQICAHDRRKFGKGGWGRISIGLYSLYMIKWIEHFSLSQFLVIRLEDYDGNPREYMKTIFDFLDLSEPDESEWNMITFNNHVNENKIYREPIRQDTEKLLRDFYEPYNTLLSSILNDGKFKWTQQPGDMTLRDHQLKEAASIKNEPSRNHETLSAEQRKMEAIKLRSLQRHKHMKDNHLDGHLGDANNQHGVGRFLNESNNAETDYIKRERERIHFLRGRDIGEVDVQFQSLFRPERFDISDLPRADDFNSWFSESPVISRDKGEIKNKEDAAQQLCSAAFGLDLYALEHLLYKIGIPSTVTMESDGGRNAFHCLSLVSHIGDSHSKSHIFSVLKGKVSWLSNYIKPAMERKMKSVASYDIVNGLGEAIVNAAKWLLKANVNFKLGDTFMNTPLHYAAQGGMESLVEILLSNGADPNAVNSEDRTPLHFAAAYGHAKVAGQLIESGADLDRMDHYGVSPKTIFSSPGPIYKSEAKEMLGITQRDARKIDRLVNPELHDASEKGSWAGDGGWGSERMKGFERDMECDIDQYWADEITGEEVFKNYIASNAPVLIRGLISSWPAIQSYTYANLTKRFGNVRVQVSDIPYAKKFGGSVSTDMLLSEYIEEVKDHKIIGESHPWYVFRGHPIPTLSDGPGSFVNYEDCPTPKPIYDAFKLLKNPNQKTVAVGGPSSRDNFINAQWAFGGEGTGAPVHFHNTAWNALVYGAKKWIVYPPHYKIMSSKQILDFYETDMGFYAKKGIKPLTCIQTAGDVMIIPESWGHGVLNLQESIAVATEAKYSLWRMKSPMKVMNSLPSDNREDLKKNHH